MSSRVSAASAKAPRPSQRSCERCRPSGLDERLALDLLSGAPFYRYLMLGRVIDEHFIRVVVTTVLRGLAPEQRTIGKRRVSRHVKPR